MNPIFTELLNKIPDYKTFLTLEELDEWIADGVPGTAEP